MQFSTSSLIYLQVMDCIKREIISGRRCPGERVESVRALAAFYGINLNTMQRACSELEREGVLVTRRGVGSFVTEDQELIHRLREHMAHELVEHFRREMAALGFTEEEMTMRLRGGKP